MSRLRAYQLGNKGGKFSLFNKQTKRFILIEARLTEQSEKNLDEEMEICGVKNISLLHITSWDQDHCNANELEKILENYKPQKIEYPGYPPHTLNGKNSLKLIKKYEKETKKVTQKISSEFIKSLSTASNNGKSNVVYNNHKLNLKESNDNSTIKLFRETKFNVASLGDVESGEIRDLLLSSSIFKNEIDILILPHHGANNGFITDDFLKITKPSIAICSSDYGNMYDHPDEEIRELLYANDIPIYTTKTGDVEIEATDENNYLIINYKSNGEKISSINTAKIK